MDKLQLPNIDVKVDGTEVTATHRKTQGTTRFPVKLLEQWLTKKLREDLTSFLKRPK